MENTYTVERTQYGLLVRGPIPVSDFAALSKEWAKALGATFAVCRKADRSKWEEEVNRAASELAGDNKELAWLIGIDTGESSLTIFHILSPYRLRHPQDFEPSLPHDPDDFGRCYRLIERFPGWRGRLPEVAAKYPFWGPMITAWDELCTLWNEESPTGRCPKLYERIQQLVEEGERLDGNED